MHRRNVAFERRRPAGVVAVMVAVIGLGGSVGAASDDEAETSVRRLVGQIIEILASNGLGEDGRLGDLAEVIEEEADLALLGQLVLGRHWRTMDDQQKAEYLGLFRQLTLRKFAGYLHAYTGDDLGPSDQVFEITGSRRVNDHDTIVESKVRPPDREPLDVSWRLRGADDPVVIDVVVENVSLLVSQRSEFAAVIERHGVEGLLTELRARLDRAASATSRPARPSAPA